jgi:hypothetical protein
MCFNAHRLALAAALTWISTAQAADPSPAPTLNTNFDLRLSLGDLGAPGEVAAIKDGKDLRVTSGASLLLERCRQDKEHWKQDGFLARLAHKTMFSVISCREKADPSLHVMFSKKNPQEARAHLDLHGAGSSWLHSYEVLRNRVTFARTSSYDMQRALLIRSGVSAPPPRFGVGENFRRYLNDIAGPRSLATQAILWPGVLSARSAAGMDKGMSYQQQAWTVAVRTVAAQTLEFGMSLGLHQDNHFYASGSKGVGKRTGIALYRVLMVRGRAGEELALPRITAGIFTPFLMRTWNPGGSVRSDPAMEVGYLFSRYVATSLWTEFQPDLLRGIRAMFGMGGKPAR